MGRQFEDLSERGVKVGERDPGELEMERLAALEREDTSCGVDEEGQGDLPLVSPSKTKTSAGDVSKLDQSSPIVAR